MKRGKKFSEVSRKKNIYLCTHETFGLNDKMRGGGVCVERVKGGKKKDE